MLINTPHLVLFLHEKRRGTMRLSSRWHKMELARDDTADKNSYTLLAASSTFILGFIHSLNTGKFRMASGVKFPTPYGMFPLFVLSPPLHPSPLPFSANSIKPN